MARANAVKTNCKDILKVEKYNEYNYGHDGHYLNLIHRSAGTSQAPTIRQPITYTANSIPWAALLCRHAPYSISEDGPLWPKSPKNPKSSLVKHADL
ncbi:hypothetical protein GQ44DRAFT_503856 [Phaeosphaeriaceae sp. PMI808]|nr:hypothetical protein GQ44DRAFT_503856 [Phaeosphaeriaceae sp. PMI808]